MKYIHGRTLYYCLALQVLFFSILDVLLVDSGRSSRVNRRCPEPEYNGFKEMKKFKKTLDVHTGSCGPTWGWTFVPTAQHRPVVVRNAIIIITHRTYRVTLLEHPKGSTMVFSLQWLRVINYTRSAVFLRVKLTKSSFNDRVYSLRSAIIGGTRNFYYIGSLLNPIIPIISKFKGACNKK